MSEVAGIKVCDGCAYRATEVNVMVSIQDSIQLCDECVEQAKRQIDMFNEEKTNDQM